ncbi:hypothetical protein AB0903_09845 [Streptomyces sp. NPDC048389]|uniref:hypothetical protein n=1 Tax=Streptomyces sp. NPDC048389 TaxID=3154622 RepID=UPI0034562397
MFGAGVAAASDTTSDKDNTGGDKTNVVICEQHSRVGDDTFQLGLVNIATGPITLLGSGPATATSVQQICSGEDTVAGNSSTAETSSALDLVLDLI